MKTAIIVWIKELVLSLACQLDRLITKLHVPATPAQRAAATSGPVEIEPPTMEDIRAFMATCHWRDRLAWWLEQHVTGTMWDWAFPGSNTELDVAEETPAEYRTARQNDYLEVVYGSVESVPSVSAPAAEGGA